MKQYFYLVVLFVLASCAVERVVQLPDIQSALITEVSDTSPVYVFYDEAQTDSTLFNQKKITSSTNWLVNIDKRLTLEKVLPHLQSLQNKRNKVDVRKNTNTKNYFTCNDLSTQNLGFIDFTDIKFSEFSDDDSDVPDIEPTTKSIFIHFFSEDLVSVASFYNNQQLDDNMLEINDFFTNFKELIEPSVSNMIYSSFDKELTFQQYITIKSKLNSFQKDNLMIDSKEYFD